jgi:hypothetical protein
MGDKVIPESVSRLVHDPSRYNTDKESIPVQIASNLGTGLLGVGNKLTFGIPEAILR